MVLFFTAIGTSIKSEQGKCTNPSDKAIHQRRGSEFEKLFRSFAGVFVTQSQYETKIQEATGLSATCASCYGDIYICGWQNCKMGCSASGEPCHVCLKDAGCTDALNKCRGNVM